MKNSIAFSIIKAVIFILSGILAIGFGLRPGQRNLAALIIIQTRPATYSDSPVDPDIQRLQGRLLIQKGDASAAYPLLQAGINGFSSALAYFDLCRLYWENSAWQQALTACQTGNVDPNYWINVGLSLTEDGNQIGAMRAYLMSILIDPDFKSGPQLLLYERNQADVQERIDLMLEFTKNYPVFSGYPYFILGEAFFKVENYTLAKDNLLQAQALTHEIDDIDKYLRRLAQIIP